MSNYKYNTATDLFVKDAYNIYLTGTNKFCIGKHIVNLMFISSPIAAPAAMRENPEFINIQSIFANDISFSDDKTIDFNDYQLRVIRSSSYNRSNINYEHFLAQFNKTVKDESNRSSFSHLFNFLAHGLDLLKVEKSYVDVSITQQIIEFHLNLGKGIYVSVLKRMSSLNDNNVEYTISVNNELMSANYMSLNELQDKLIHIQKTLGIL